jgi:hypothetical protein
MPLVQHRDTLTDLIRKGAEKKQSLHDERRRQSAYYAGWDIADLPESIAYDKDNNPVVDPDEKDRALRISALFLWCVETRYIKITRCIALIGAFFILTVDASTDPDTLRGLIDFVYALDYIVNIYYILDGGLKMLSMYSYICIAKNCGQMITTTTYFRRSGVFDVPLSLMCLVYAKDTDVNQWLHLMRCMTLSFFFLEQMPQIDVLMSGISAGLRSTLYTWSLMILIFLVYAATGVIFFRDNDPYHFGNIGMAMWTYFEMTTLDNWSDVLQINYHGCANFDAGYYEPGVGQPTVITDYGTFYLPVCALPNRSPLVSSGLFTLFILMSGFVMVSLTVAFVTTGINNKLRTLKEEEDELELLMEQGKAPVKNNADHAPKPRKPSVVQTGFFKTKAVLRRTASGLSGYGDSTSSGFTGGRFGSLDSADSDHLEHPSLGVKRTVSVESAEYYRDYGSGADVKKVRVKKPKNGVADTELLRALLLQVWKAEDSGGGGGILKEEHAVNLQRRKGMLADSKKVGNFNAVSFKRTMRNMKDLPLVRTDFMKMLMKTGVSMRTIVGNRYGTVLLYTTICYYYILYCYCAILLLLLLLLLCYYYYFY